MTQVYAVVKVKDLKVACEQYAAEQSLRMQDQQDKIELLKLLRVTRDGVAWLQKQLDVYSFKIEAQAEIIGSLSATIERMSVELRDTTSLLQVVATDSVEDDSHSCAEISDGVDKERA